MFFLLNLASQSDGTPDLVTPVFASQPVPLTPGFIHQFAIQPFSFPPNEVVQVAALPCFVLFCRPFEPCDLV